MVKKEISKLKKLLIQESSTLVAKNPLFLEY